MKKSIRTLLVLPLIAGLLAISSPAWAVDPVSGYDVSYPQCDQVLPTDGSFNIVGVNGGRVFDENACLDQLLAWGGGAIAQLYVNTGNPGPELSRFWPVGQSTPKNCNAANPDTTECAYNYGYNGAKDSYRLAKAAYERLGISASPSSTKWWLDVEISNSWREDPKLNIAALSGAAHYLQSVAKVKQLGIYSTPYQWSLITADTLEFSDLPSWHALGPGTMDMAVNECATALGFTGSPLLMAQYVDEAMNIDVNLACTLSIKTITKLANTTTAKVKPAAYITLKAKLTTYSGATMANQKVKVTFAGKTYWLVSNSYGNVAKKVKAPATRGYYKVKFAYSGNSFLDSSSVTKSVRVTY